MKIGVEANHIPNCRERGVFETLDFAVEHGVGGLFFKSILDLSPSLDEGRLREIRARADHLDLYLEVGLGRINPYNTALSPEIRHLGGGDYVRGMERMICACRAIGCTELLAGTATWNAGYPGRCAFDRFRTDVDWADQLEATERFLKKLAPALRDQGCRIDVETHEEITTFEVVRLVERVGPEVVGITFDTANVLARAEDPVAAARRVAPYTHLTHAKDAILYFVETGLERQIRPCGEGVIDWGTILPILAEHSPDLHLSIEDHAGEMEVAILDPVWMAAHPDLSREELDVVKGLAQRCEERIERGEIPAPGEYGAIPYEEHRIERFRASIGALRRVTREKGLNGSESSS